MQKVLIALFATGAAALAPAPATGVANRRAALQKVAGAVAGALALPQVASADGAVSTTTIQRSRGIYGGRIAALSGAVSKGDFAAVADEKNAFILFNSGAYQKKGQANKSAKAVAQEGTAEIFAAVDAKDAGKLKAAYAAYTKNAPQGVCHGRPGLRERLRLEEPHAEGHGVPALGRDLLDGTGTRPCNRASDSIQGGRGRHRSGM
jgi:hypothetical protein